MSISRVLSNSIRLSIDYTGSLSWTIANSDPDSDSKNYNFSVWGQNFSALESDTGFEEYIFHKLRTRKISQVCYQRMLRMGVFKLNVVRRSDSIRGLDDRHIHRMARCQHEQHALP